MLKLIYTFGHVRTVNSRCYGRCGVKKLVPLYTFFKFYTQLELNSARLFQNVFNKCSRVLNFAIFWGTYRLKIPARYTSANISQSPLISQWLTYHRKTPSYM